MEVTSCSFKKKKGFNKAKKKIQEIKKKPSSKKRKRIDSILEVRKTEKDIEALDDKIILKDNVDNI